MRDFDIEFFFLQQEKLYDIYTAVILVKFSSTEKICIKI